MEIYQKFILDDEVISENSYIASNNAARLPLIEYSIANFCPKCGQVWARVSRNNFEWSVKTINCDKCESSRTIRSLYPIAGSFYDTNQDSRQLDTWPKEIIDYEFNILLNLIEYITKNLNSEDFDGF